MLPMVDEKPRRRPSHGLRAERERPHGLLKNVESALDWLLSHENDGYRRAYKKVPKGETLARAFRRPSRNP